MKKVVIVGGGFAGLNAAKKLCREKEVYLTVIDRRNYHLFQPLLYQVAMAALGSAEIAQPIRSLFSGYENVRILQEDVRAIDQPNKLVVTNFSSYAYDYLIICCGVQHAYFGHEEWEDYAPGLKTIEQAAEIRRRVLTAFELAEKEMDPTKQKQLLSFVVIGGGPTGVELAGAIGELSRFTLARDFRHIDPKIARVILVEAGERILPSFDAKLASRVVRDLESVGVQVWTKSQVTDLDGHFVTVGEEKIKAGTVLWAAGVKASMFDQKMDVETDSSGRIMVQPDLSLPGDPSVFVIGDQAHFSHGLEEPLPAMAPAAMQQGRHAADNVMRLIRGDETLPFVYQDKGQMATIGKSRAIVEVGPIKLVGFFAWVLWLSIHIYYLMGFKNRLFVMLQWAWSYFSSARRSRLILDKDWHFYRKKPENPESP